MMPVPWLQILDAVIGLTDLARSRKIRKLSEENAEAGTQQLESTGRAAAGGALETRLAGVVVAALKEAFDRDTRRLELEREQMAADRLRAERALKLELRRQAADREIGRLRLLAGIALASWLGTLFFAGRVIAGHAAARAALGAGWALLLAALAASFAAQSAVASGIARSDDSETGVGVGGALAPWLIVIGLAIVGVAVLIG
jgi:hypothetical protein